MQPRPPENQPLGLNLGDIYYALFRRKWMVVFFSAAGVLAAAGIVLSRPPQYKAEAKLLVRYIRDSKAVDVAVGTQAQIRSPDERGDNIINSELEILTSRDLANQVVEAVGADKVLGKAGGATNRAAAASVVVKGLAVEVPRRSNVIKVTFQHPDPETAQTVLHQLILSYRRKNFEVHRAVGIFDEFLTKKTDELRALLSQTDEDLRKLKLKANVTSLDESKRNIADQLAHIRQQLVDAEAELAQRRTVLAQLQQQLALASAAPTNAAPTNAALAVVEPPLDPEKERQYRSICARLESVRNRELDLLLQFTAASPEVKAVREQLAVAEQAKLKLETEEPRLLRAQSRELAASPPLLSLLPGRSAPVTDLAAEQAQVAALIARISVLTNYLAEARAEIASLNEAEGGITDLQRRKEIAEANYRYFSAGLEQTRIDAALGSTDTSSVSIVEEASLAGRDLTPTLKAVLIALCAGLGGGIGLALLLEFGLSQTIKRPIDIEQKLRLPLFLSIPDFSRNGYVRPGLRQIGPHSSTAPAEASPASEDEPTQALSVPTDPLAEYLEALRDRVIMYFQIKEMTHKPKLVGITGVARGEGVSPLATGLAQTLSETGDGKVLLVDMHPQKGPAVRPFYHGEAACALDDALEQEKRTPAHVQDNLYVAAATTATGSKVGIVPRRFVSLVPKMKASDYDYIIFDLPAVNQTSVTSKIAGLLDITLVVFESERTSLEQAKRSLAMLADSHATVGAVLNRYHDYLPAKLSIDL